MQKLYKIAILGMGGVGGYIGGLLANSRFPILEVFFIARGESLKAIKENGLKLSMDADEIMAHPKLATDSPAEIGKIDFLICCVKGYDLNESLKPFAQIVDRYTVILPFLNGINISDKIKKILPEAQVWEGCIYIASRLTGPGKIKQSGAMRQIILGSKDASPEALLVLENIFQQSGMDVSIGQDMVQQVWIKYFFISVLATITSFYDAPTGDIVRDSERTERLQDVIQEIYLVASAIRVQLPADLKKNVFDKIVALPPDSGSSMFADFRKGGRTEVEELTGDIVRLGKKMNVPTPVYQMMYESLIKRAASFQTT